MGFNTGGGSNSHPKLKRDRHGIPSKVYLKNYRKAVWEKCPGMDWCFARTQRDPAGVPQGGWQEAAGNVFR